MPRLEVMGTPPARRRPGGTTRVGLDIPWWQLSGDAFGAVAPGEVFIVGGAVTQTAVEDADEAVGDGA